MNKRRFRSSTRRGAVATLLGLLLGGSAWAQTPDADSVPDISVASQPGRPYDSRTREPGRLLDLQRRLDAIGATDTSECNIAYAANKAQAWLNFGKYAAAEQLPAADRSAGLNNAAALVEGLEHHEAAVSDTPELPAARHVRDDLWQAISTVKHDGRLCAAPKMTAYCEVQLAWADYEAGAGGRRHVDPYVRIAEDYCGTAIAAEPLPLADTAVIRELPAPATPESAAAPPPATVPEPLAVSVLFPHNRARRSDIRAPGRAELRRMAKYLKSLPKGTRVMVAGHADLTGNPQYNLRLSDRRARSVVRELQLLGVHNVRIKKAALGDSQPLVQCPVDNRVAERRRYLQCLEPNRRVVVHLVTDPQ
jgi:outer membrane protein OmpA-like peptidoglycan-associated protein